MKRRLAAILAADVAGYSVLMNADEDATYSTWRSARGEVIDPNIAAQQGRIVKHTGDGFLAEFPTVLAAVQCAVDIQEQMHRRNEGENPARRFEFRIGINLGDIIVDNEDIHGDGVNIAARLESLAEAGGVCVSADVYHQVSSRPGFDFEDLGEQRVKNMPAALHVYRVVKAGRAFVPTSHPPAPATARTGGNAVEAMLESATGGWQRAPAPMVGRQRERELLQAAFEEADGGRGNLVLIRGEPGIGKSCLASTFAQEAETRGALAVCGQCHETLGSPPYWPWLQLLKALQLASGSHDANSHNLFEALTASPARARSGPQSNFVGDAGSEQFMLFTRIAALLAEHASQRTLVLVIDDLHWADRSSLLLLSHLCRKLAEQRILVMATYRDVEVSRKHPLFDALSEINRVASLRRIALKGLSASDVTGLISSTVDRPLPEGVLSALYQKTEGNPLFVSEVARLLKQGDAGHGNGQWQIEIPEGIREAIGRRLNELSDECNEVLSFATVIGRQFELATLHELLPASDHLHTLQHLEEAVAHGIIEQAGHAPMAFRFCHVLIRDILYDELSLAKRLLLHRKVADILVSSRLQGHEPSLGEIARHYYQALQDDHGDAAVEYAILAAEHAVGVSAYNEAGEYYQIALDVVSLNEKRHGPRKAEICLRISECMQNAGAPSRQCLAWCNRAMEEAKKVRQYGVFAQAACRKVYSARAFTHVRESLKDIDEALAYIGEGELVLRANVLAHRAGALKFNNRRREAEQVAFQAVAVAAESGDVLVHCNALCMALLALRGRPEKLSERIELGERALALARAEGDDSLSCDPLEWLILSYQEKGDLARVRALIGELEAAVENASEFKSHYFAASASAWLALFEGRWAAAETLIENALELGSGKLDGGADGVYGAQMFLLSRELGRLPMMRASLQQVTERSTSVWKPGLLAAFTELGLREQACALFDELADDDFRRVAEDELYLTCLVYLSEACAELGRDDAAGALYQRLLPYSGQMVSHPTAVCYGPADLYLGMLASRMNNLAEAERLLLQAAAVCDKASPNIWQAHARYRHAQVLKRHHAGERDVDGTPGFASLCTEARLLARRFGLVNLLTRIDRLESEEVDEADDGVDGLTRRELEVLALIAQGKSNKVIAAELNRSLATVASHVRAILAKTRSANRTEAAAFALERQRKHAQRNG